MSLSYNKGGLHPRTMKFLSKALMRHKYFPLTAHGISNTSNGHSLSTPFFGPGQGSSDGTNGWGLVHDKLAKVYTRTAECGHFTGVTRKLKWRAVMGAFVNDVSLMHKRRPIETVEFLEQLTSRNVQLWTDLLWTSGGKINFRRT